MAEVFALRITAVQPLLDCYLSMDLAGIEPYLGRLREHPQSLLAAEGAICSSKDDSMILARKPV